MSVRGVPVQELPENQAPEVAYNLIEQTGEKVPLEIPVIEAEPAEEKPAKRRGRKPRQDAPADAPADDEESGDAGDDPVVEVAAVRELGS